MRLLILGGSLFLGRHLVEAALDRGHAVTTFTRGRTPGIDDARVEAIHGDRDGDLGALRGREWDAVVDTSGYLPRVVSQSLDVLADSVGHHVFVSSISVYADLSGRVHEDSPLAVLDDPASEDLQQHYGALKVACERLVLERVGSRALISRPGLIVGPHDPTGRYTYWVERVAEGGEVLAPGDPDRRVQLVDGRDLAAWTVEAAERRLAGVFNATGPEPPPTMRELLESIAAGTGGDASLTWVDDAFLLEQDVGEWSELPLWIASPELRGLLDADVSAAVREGLRFRALADTARDTLAWTRARRGPAPDKPGVQLPPAGLARKRERELLEAWRRYRTDTA